MAAERTKRSRNPLARLGELFDASALGLVTVLLLGGSFFMTWRGVRDFIASRELGDGAVSHGLVFIIVATLSLAMYVALREMIAPYFVRGWWSAIWKRIVAGALYFVLAIWSVGFGYGFWWSLVAGQSATEDGLKQTVASVRRETSDMRARLAAASSVMSSAVALSDRKAELEAARGGTCGVNSPAGPGPLARARNETQVQIAALATSVRQDWSDPLNHRLGKLEIDLQGALEAADDLEGAARKRRFDALGRTSVTAAAEIATDATARGRTIAAQLRAKADQLSVAPISGEVAYCYDPDLAAALGTAADELAQTYEVEVTPFRFAEGPDGVARVIEDLFGRISHVVQLKAAPSKATMSGRDMIALLAALGVDLALFVFGLLRGSGNRNLRPPEDEPPLQYVGEAVPAAAPDAIETQKEPAALGSDDRAKALPAPTVEKAAPRIRRVEASPAAVGIGSSASGTRSQVNEIEHVDDLIESVDGLYEVLSKDEQLVMKDQEIERLRAELDRLKGLGYVATGRPGQQFDSAVHRIVGRQASETAKGTIIATVRPGYLLSSGGLFRIAEVIVSAGPTPYEYED